VSQRYKIDPQRVVLIGFSMGGAGAWHLGAHYADRWVAVSPGAGFAETARYQRLTPDKYPPPYEQKLWGQYDVPCYVRNLFNTKTIAYSGELDKQIQAARVMEEAFRAEGRELTHLIGPGVEHKYEPKTLEELLKQIEATVEPGRDAWPDEVHLQTRTLAYHRQAWVSAEGLEEHWRDARIDAKRHADRIELKTSNVSRLQVAFEPGRPPSRLTIDGQSIALTGSALSEVLLAKGKSQWQLSSSEATSRLTRPGLQGPIDDAFRSKFLVVLPSGKSKNARFQEWVDFEIAHFIGRWRALMRAELPTVKDTDAADYLNEAGNVILFGDPDSNSAMDKLIEKTPLTFSQGKWTVGQAAYDGNQFVPALVYPKAAGRGYVVMNSGLTFREAHDKTNSQQNPKLPDWAIVDLAQPPDSFAPGKIHDAGFFDEAWQFTRMPKGP
jgi:hypothetical protein